jgi:glycosyltransferase 2 family protein
MRKAALRRLVTRVADAVRPVITSVWFRTGILVLTAAVAVWGIERVPHASPVPALVGMLPWAVGKYVLCPLRWHALSMSGRGRWWHIRAYAESELLGLLSPAHAGADLWRMHRLHRVGMGRGAAAAEVALDRLVGAVGLAVAVALTGAAMPPRLLAALAGVAVVVLVAALLVRWRRPDLFAQRPLPPPKALAQGLLLSIGYQATIVGLVYGSVTAVGHTVDPLLLVGVFGASQVAGIIPGVHGASPRDGALAFGLTTLGVSWGAAIGAVALMAVLPWLPGLALGGGSFAARRLAAMRAA